MGHYPLSTNIYPTISNSFVAREHSALLSPLFAHVDKTKNLDAGYDILEIKLCSPRSWVSHCPSHWDFTKRMDTFSAFGDDEVSTSSSCFLSVVVDTLG